MKLFNLLKPELILVDCHECRTGDLLEEMVRHLLTRGVISDEKTTLKKLLERERLGATSIGNHSAVPHTKLKELKEPVVAVGVSRAGFTYHKDDKEPVHFIILILSPADAPIVHLQILAAAAALIKKSDRLIKELLTVKNPEALITVIQKYEAAND